MVSNEKSYLSNIMKVSRMTFAGLVFGGWLL